MKKSLSFKRLRVLLEWSVDVISSPDKIARATSQQLMVSYTADTSAALHGSLPVGAVSVVAVFHCFWPPFSSVSVPRSSPT